MIWLFPLYLLGAAAIVAPILMHLRRKPPQERVEFSSLMFLEAQPPVPVARRKLENWLLLVLRCLALILLALMFARPLWRQAPQQPGADQQATVVLLDSSASMRRGELWNEAVKATVATVRATKPNDRVAVASFDQGIQPLWSFDEDLNSANARAAALEPRLAKLRPSWFSTDLGKALVQAANWLENAELQTGVRRRIVLVSDLQEGARLEALRQVVWPENVVVKLVAVQTPRQESNFSLGLVASSPDDAPTPEGVAATPFVRVRLANMRNSESSDFTLAWEGGGTGAAGHLPAGASRVLSLPRPEASGTSAGMGQILRASGDAWDFDNRLFIAPLQPKPVNVVFIGEEAARDQAASALYYLSRALQPTASLAPALSVIPPTSPSLPPATDAVFLAGAIPTPDLLAKLNAFVAEGGLLVHAVSSAAEQAAVRQLTGIGDITLREGTPANDGYTMIGEIDTTQPLLRPFADPRLRDFTKVRFWKHRRIELKPETASALKILAKFENGDPAIISQSRGKGTLVVLAAGWQPADSQLALSTKFVPLIYGWLAASGFRNETNQSMIVGEPIPAEPGAQITGPEGETVTVEASGQVTSDSVGFYTVQMPNTDRRQVYAVNLAPEEGRVTSMEPEQLEQMGIAIEAPAEGSGAIAAFQNPERLAAADEETRQRGWLWILGALLAVLGLETWIAGRNRSAGEASPLAA